MTYHKTSGIVNYDISKVSKKLGGTFMKKILAIVTMAAMVAGAFAVDVAANVQMWGMLAEKENGADFKLGPFLKSTKEQDTDALTFAVSGDEAGASFKAFYTSGTPDKDNGVNLMIRYPAVWFKPASWLKVNVGWCEDDGLFKEKNHWWKVAAGGPLSGAQGWYARWESCAAFKGYGFLLTATPIEGLRIEAGIGSLSGTDNSTAPFITFKDADTFADKLSDCGIYAKYAINNITFGAGYRRTTAFDIAALGAEITNVGPLQDALIQARFNIDDTHNWWASQKDKKLSGIVIDNYFKLSAGPATIHIAAPVTLRGFNKDFAEGTDPSYMAVDVKAVMGIGSGTGYFMIGTPAYLHSDMSEGGSMIGWTLDDNFDPCLEVRPGYQFKVGGASLDVGAALVMSEKFKTVNFYIPFKVSLGF